MLKADGKGLTLRTYLEPEGMEAIEEAASSSIDRLLIRLLCHLGC